MKSFVCLLAFSALLPSVNAQAGGSLTPTGPPAKTMKSLDEVEARIPLVDGEPGVAVASNGTITISQPGSYYLVGNLSKDTLGSGIIILASAVTVDLNGFRVSGSITTTGHFGVHVAGAQVSPLTGIRVYNGTIEGFGSSVQLDYASGCQIEKLRCKDSAHGVVLASPNGECAGNFISNCRFHENSITGIRLSSGGAGLIKGNRISDCSFWESGNNGVELVASTGQINGNVISGCQFATGSGSGIRFYTSAAGAECNGNKIVGCSFTDLTDKGISISGGGGEVKGTVIEDCVFSNLGGNGVYCYGFFNSIIGGVIRRNSFEGTTNRGIYVYQSDAIRIEQNHVSGTLGASAVGIYLRGSKNFIVKNTCMGQSDNFDLGSGNTFGPEDSTSGALANTNPWANFSLN